MYYAFTETILYPYDGNMDTNQPWDDALGDPESSTFIDTATKYEEYVSEKKDQFFLTFEITVQYEFIEIDKH